jgi:rfaE bifunctional protein kinase chain/domain
MAFNVVRNRLVALVSSLAGRRLVVAGDYVLDRFVYGHPKRISREAPVLILRFWKEESLPGGAGNTAANIAALGGVPLPVGVVGDDEAGRTLRRILAERGIETKGLVTASEYATPMKTRILGGAPHSIKQQIVRLDREALLSAGGETAAKLKSRLAESADHASGAVLSDYGYGAVSKDAVAPLRRAMPAAAPILVDSRHGLRHYRGADALTPNEEELEECAGQPLGDSAVMLEQAAAALRKETGCPMLLVTRGSRGMTLFRDGDPPVHIPVHGTDQVADVTGAGDTVLASFSLALASGSTPLEAALLANFAGGVVVMKMGTAVVTPEELRDAIASDRVILGS